MRELFVFAIFAAELGFTNAKIFARVMVIDSFDIEGISNIEHVRINVGEMNALIAPNGYGKSNVLGAISFGLDFLNANTEGRQHMLSNGFAPINEAMVHNNFRFEINGRLSTDEPAQLFLYGFECEWTTDDKEGCVVSEWLKVKLANEQRYRQLLNRASKETCLVVPSPKGRCNKPFEVFSLQLALPMIANGALFFSDTAKRICSITIPNLETLDNPESYFSMDENAGVPLLGGRTLSEYIFFLKKTDGSNYGILYDGIKQLIPRIAEFEPDEITLSDGRSRVYDIRVREKFNTIPTSIRMLSSGSKRMIFLFTLCIAAKKQNIPMIMMEEPENSVHPRMMENLLLTLQNYASDTKILMTSHSPYLMRYLRPDQMYFGLPKNDGLAHFAQINPSKLKYLYKYAGDMELTIGEFMFDFMLDMEGDNEKIEQFFIQ